MPSLIAKVTKEGSQEAFLYQCSMCDAVFGTDRITPSLTKAQVNKINDWFRAHCAEKHPDFTPIVELHQPEDVNQAAARIVREATEE